MKTSGKSLRWVLAAAALACGSAAHAADWQPAGMYVQAGDGKHHVTSGTVGALWTWQWQRNIRGGVLTGSTDAFISYWRAENFSGGHQGLMQLGVMPLVRYSFAPTGPTWFAEAGIGVSWLDKTYHTPERRFSTRGNFIDVLAVGHSFGEDARHELSLRATHFSNCGIKKPNPGEEFVQLRYALKF